MGNAFYRIGEFTGNNSEYFLLAFKNKTAISMMVVSFLVLLLSVVYSLFTRAFGSSMKLLMHLFQSLIGDVSVDLSGVYRAVAEQGLH